MSASIKVLQTYLNQSGADLEVDGIKGAKTLSAIDALDVPTWVKTALKEVGVKEVLGSGNSVRVLQYHDFTTGDYDSDGIAWCGSFMAFVMATNGYGTPTYPERAKSWLQFGQSHIPVVGAIAVKSRTGGGHVCMVIGQDKEGGLWCVGGNQNDEVNIQRYNREVFIDFRVPSLYKSNNLPIFYLGMEGRAKES